VISWHVPFSGIELVDTTSFLTDPATVVVLAMGEGQELLGWAWGLRQRHVGGYSQLQLYEIEVAVQQRGLGIGRALVDWFVDLARQEGDRKMWLFTDHDNLPAKALYEATGGRRSAHDDAGYWWSIQ
jgi:ribosomal protein S18 acetylase RimI-like enzyme